MCTWTEAPLTPAAKALLNLLARVLFICSNSWWKLNTCDIQAGVNCNSASSDSGWPATPSATEGPEAAVNRRWWSQDRSCALSPTSLRERDCLPRRKWHSINLKWRYPRYIDNYRPYVRDNFIAELENLTNPNLNLSRWRSYAVVPMSQLALNR